MHTKRHTRNHYVAQPQPVKAPATVLCVWWEPTSSEQIVVGNESQRHHKHTHTPARNHQPQSETQTAHTLTKRTNKKKNAQPAVGLHWL